MAVLGLDIDPIKIKKINTGQSYIKHIPSEVIQQQVSAGRLSASTDFAGIKQVDAVVICVPTPLNKNREPDISYILMTGQAIAPHLRKGQLVVLESTTYPGTTDSDLRAVLEEGSGLKAGIDFHLAFSPEREDPGNPESKVALIPKIVGGLTPECQRRAAVLAEPAFGIGRGSIEPRRAVRETQCGARQRDRWSIFECRDSAGGEAFRFH